MARVSSSSVPLRQLTTATSSSGRGVVFRSLRGSTVGAGSSSGDGVESSLSDVRAPATSEAAATPTPPSSTSTTVSASSSSSRSELGLAIVAALMFVLAVAVVLARRRRKSLQVVVQQRRDAFGLDDCSSVDWFHSTDVSLVAAATATAAAADQTHGTDSFCGSWEHPDVVASRLPANEVRLVQRIHRGANSDVYRGRFRGAFVAVKKPLAQWLANVRHIDALFCEVRLLASLRHANIVAFLGVAWHSLLDVNMVTEFMDGGDLCALLWRFDSDENMFNRRPKGFDRDKVVIAAQVASALAYLHAQTPRKLTHMALRSRNVLLSTKWTAKLIDFRAASIEKYIYDLPTASAHGVWSAPEVLRGEMANDKADIFSFGVLLAEMDSHRAPYANHAATNIGVSESESEYEVESESERGSANYSALLARIASGRARVHFSPASSSAFTPLPSTSTAVPTVGELVSHRQARDAASNNSKSGNATGVRSVLSLVSAASFIASPFVHAEVARIGLSCVSLDPKSRPTAQELERELLALAQTFDAFESR